MIEIKYKCKQVEDIPIEISFPNFCNLKCNFCLQKASIDSNDYKNFLINYNFRKTITILNYLVKDFNKVSLRFVGGETLLFPILDMIKSLDKNKFNYKIITNGTLSTKLNELCEYCNQNNIEFTYSASLHESEIKDINEWFNNLPGKDKNLLRVNIVETLDNHNFVKELKDKYGNLIDVQPMRDHHTNILVDTTLQDKDYLINGVDSTRTDVINTLRNNHFGGKCYSRYYLKIDKNYNHSLYQCAGNDKKVKLDLSTPLTKYKICNSKTKCVACGLYYFIKIGEIK